MKQTMGTLLLLLMAVAAWGQNPATTTDVKVNAVQQPKKATQSAKPASSAKPAEASGAHKAAPVAHKVVPAQPVAQAQKPLVTAKSQVKVQPAKASQNPAKLVAAKAVQASAKPAVVKPAVAKSNPIPVKAMQGAVKPAAMKPVAAKPVQIALKPVVNPAAKAKIVAVPKAKAEALAAVKPVATAKVDVKDSAKPEGSEKEKKESNGLISVVGKRDPFLSPVMNQTMTGPGCSVGKKCLAIDQIMVRGIVKADSGMIAVVVNALDKAYFLRENDPVFNGYVEKITEDSIIFKEMYQDKLGKPFTRDVTKRIPAPVV